jgi:serine/threonine protein kinase
VDPITEREVNRSHIITAPTQDVLSLLATSPAGCKVKGAKQRAQLQALKSLLEQCLSYDVSKRLTAAQAYKHSFFQQKDW